MKRYLVKLGSHVDLKKCDPNFPQNQVKNENELQEY